MALQSNSRMTRHKVIPGTGGTNEAINPFLDELSNQGSNVKEKPEITRKRKTTGSSIPSGDNKIIEEKKKEGETSMMEEKNSSENEIKATKEELIKAEEKKIKKKPKSPSLKRLSSIKSEYFTPKKPSFKKLIE